MALIKVKEIIGTSSKGFHEAFKEAIEQACEQKKNVTGAKILSHTVGIKNGQIAEYKVDVKVAYRWEKELHGQS
jgi:flavin-binding protein dodecin